MPIDPRIVLGVQAPHLESRRTVQPLDPLDVAHKSMALQALMGQQQLQGLQLQQARQGMADEQAVREAYRASGGDSGMLRKLLGDRGAYKQLQELDKYELEAAGKRATIDKDQAAAAKSRYDVAIGDIKRVASILSTAQDQPSWDMARQVLVQEKPDLAAKLPEQFNPQFVQTQIAQGMTIAERLADQRARDTQAITLRGQDMTAATARRGQDIGAQTAREGHGVTMRGQDIGAATQRRGQDLTAATTRRGQDMQFDPSLAQQRAQATAMGKEAGEAQAQAQINLPQATATAEKAIRLVDDLLKHPGFSTTVGATLVPGTRFVPGTDAADFQARFDELKGGAFLQAFETLKGGGQITEREGQVATQAMTRMNLAQSEKEFRTAAREFQQIASAALRRAKQKAGQASTGATGSFATPLPGGESRGASYYIDRVMEGK